MGSNLTQTYVNLTSICEGRIPIVHSERRTHRCSVAIASFPHFVCQTVHADEDHVAATPTSASELPCDVGRLTRWPASWLPGWMAGWPVGACQSLLPGCLRPYCTVSCKALQGHQLLACMPANLCPVHGCQLIRCACLARTIEQWLLLAIALQKPGLPLGRSTRT
jgi:hypothetical protein